MAKENETYFTIVNQSGRTIKQNEQIFYRYGCKSNASLLVNYGFTYPGNRFDFTELMLWINPASFEPKDLICLDNQETDGIQEVRLKLDQLSDVLLAYLRFAVKLRS